MIIEHYNNSEIAWFWGIVIGCIWGFVLGFIASIQ